MFFPFFPRYPFNALKLLLIFQPLVKTFWSAPQYQLESAAEKWAAFLPASAAADLPAGNLGNWFLWEEGACADQQGELHVRGRDPKVQINVIQLLLQRFAPGPLIFYSLEISKKSV